MLLTILTIMTGQISAQSFTQEIDLGQEEELNDVISVSNNRFIVASVVGDSIDDYFPYYLNSHILNLDSIGQVVSSYQINDFYAIQLYKKSNMFFVYGTLQGNVQGSAIYSFNYQFVMVDSLKFITSERHKSAYKISIDNRGEINIPFTQFDSIQNYYYSSLLKIDANLNIVDTVLYDTVSFTVSTGKFNSSNNILVYQEAVNYRQMPSKTRNPIFVVDSNGQKLQQVSTVMPVYNSQLDDSLMISRFPHLEELPNKNVVLSGILQNQQSYVPGSSEYIYDYGIIVYDSNMNYLSHQVLGLVDTADFPATTNIAVVDSSFYIAGVSQWYPNDYYKNINNFIRVSQFDFQGNLINSRNYQVGDFVKINSIKPTEDKGLILVGSNYKLFGGTGGLNGFVMKIDSLGNLNTNINKVNGQTIAKDNYKIYPNPAKDELKLLKLNQFKPYEFELYDTFGRLVKTVSWREDHQTVDVSSLASGMYVYRIIDEEGNVGSGKLIME